MIAHCCYAANVCRAWVNRETAPLEGNGEKNPPAFETAGDGVRPGVRLSTDLFYLARADAARAYVHAYMSTVRSDGLHGLQVRF